MEVYALGIKEFLFIRKMYKAVPKGKCGRTTLCSDLWCWPGSPGASLCDVQCGLQASCSWAGKGTEESWAQTEMHSLVWGSWPPALLPWRGQDWKKQQGCGQIWVNTGRSAILRGATPYLSHAIAPLPLLLLHGRSKLVAAQQNFY